MLNELYSDYDNITEEKNALRTKTNQFYGQITFLLPILWTNKFSILAANDVFVK